MNAQRSSRLGLALFDRFIPDNDPLRGDLLEEFEFRRSQWWLWRQVLGAIIWRRPLLPSQSISTMTVLGAALLLLVSFEAVFAFNVVHRLLFGPAMPNITGYFYLWQRQGLFPTGDRVLPPVLWIPALISAAASLPAGWVIARFHPQHKRLVVGLFTLSVALCAVFNLASPFVSQYLTMLIFVIGLLVGARLAAAAEQGPTTVSGVIP
jgi:hypothetical protein